MSNGWTVAGLVTNNLVPVQKLNYLPSFFQNKTRLGRNVSKGNMCKRDRAKISQGLSRSPYPIFITSVTTIYAQNSQVFLQPLNLPWAHLVFPSVFKVALRGNSRNFTFTHVGILQAPRSQHNLLLLASWPLSTGASHDSASQSPCDHSRPPALPVFASDQILSLLFLKLCFPSVPPHKPPWQSRPSPLQIILTIF